MRVKKESEKAGLKLSIQKTKIMASSLITSWQIDGEKNGNNDRLYFWGIFCTCIDINIQENIVLLAYVPTSTREKNKF